MLKPQWTFILSILAGLLLNAFALAGDRVMGGEVAVPRDMNPGDSIDLTGTWLYKPGYDIGSDESPQTNERDRGYVKVPVPSLLNEIQWWLDDSDDFRKHERERLSKLGFDTDRAEDGWYRLWIDVPELPKDRRIFIEFDGIAMISRAFMNGHDLGEHKGMFSRISHDLTPHLKPGKNLLAVFVSMEKIPPDQLQLGEAVTVNLTSSKVMTMSKGMFGPLSPNADNRAYDLHGIWQPVKLVMRGGAVIDQVFFCTTPDRDGAMIEVAARSLDEAQPVKITARFIDENDPQSVREFSTAGQIGRETRTIQFGGGGLKPKLWTPSEPNLYRLEIALESQQGEVLDRWSHNVGFRTFEIKEGQFLLNGKPYWLRGANHLPYGKNPFDPELPRKLIQLMHDGNQRITRTHCTPWNNTWLSAADEIGLGVSIEGIRPWALVGKIPPPPREMVEHWKMEHADTIKRLRNHPSVLIWTIGNEMLLRDHHNVEKWEILSELVKLTRELDPTRPIVVSSDYRRDPEFYDKELKPRGIDDGDIDDIHRYDNWYRESSFIIDSKFPEEVERNKWSRPFIGQEMSSGYPDLDTGLPVLRYTRDLVVPQAWVGHHAYPGSDPGIFLAEHAKMTKRWAEQLRFQRPENRSAGFMLFANECWFSHTWDGKKVSPYPVNDAIKYAFAPVGLAIETTQRRFFAGDTIDTAIYVSNDDEQFRDFEHLTLQVQFDDGDAIEVGRVSKLPYYDTQRIEVKLAIPQAKSERQQRKLVTILRKGGDEISRTVDEIEIWRRDAGHAEASDVPLTLLSIGPDLSTFARERGGFAKVAAELPENSNGVILIGGGHDMAALEKGPVRRAIERGATAIIFSPPGETMLKLFPDDVDLATPDRIGEYADWIPAAGTKLAEGLEPMDLKWWARKDDWRAFISVGEHRLKRAGKGRELIRFIPSHGYIPERSVPGMFRTVLFEIPLGDGRLWVCNLDLESSVTVDPAARHFARNLLRAAADPKSTRKLIEVPSHEEMLKGKRPAVQ
jgi:beta-galactosidase